MTPIRYTVKDGITYFYYKTSELIKFVRQGFKFGDVGMLLVYRENNILTYKGFGTIDHPIRTMCTLSLVHNPLFDGKMITAKTILYKFKIYNDRLIK